MAESPRLLFDHLGIVVSTLEEGRRHLTETLQITRWTVPYDDQGIGVSVQFGVGASGPAMELIAPLGETSPVANALRTGHRILSHVAYATADLEGSARHLGEQGCISTGPAHPAVAYSGRRVQFFISPLRLMIELIELPVGFAGEGQQHMYAAATEEAGA